MAKTKKSTRSFKPSKSLIYTTFQRQAGTRDKALLEGGMNCIDAGATAISISTSLLKAVINDNGRGMETLEHIERYFDTVGGKSRDGRLRSEHRLPIRGVPNRSRSNVHLRV